MELRDQFASEALNAMIATSNSWFNGRSWKSVEDMTEHYAREAYAFADAMLKERIG